MENRPAYIHGESNTDEGILIGDLAIIGRDEGAQIRLDDPQLDERVARIENKQTHYYIRDLRSNVGLQVNGKAVIEAILHEGDVIKVGSHELVFSHQKIIQTIGVG